MLKKLNQPKTLLILILLFTFIVRLIRIDQPPKYVFDEVYHAFTAKEYLLGHKEAWEWWTTPPPGVAYEWTHPPLAKEIMALSMFIFQTTDPWAYRLPGIIFGTLSVYLIYLLGKSLFKNEQASLLAAFVYSLDGLNFVQSRTGMNDIYFITFVLASVLFFVRKRLLLSAVFFGLALASKWTTIYLMALFFVFLIRYKQIFKLWYFFIIPPLIYLASYLPFFIQGHSFDTFIGLQKQMWWYHTGLKATHDYASPWWSWPLNLFPVWYHVEYKNNLIGNIFASGNFVLYSFGIVSIIATALEIFKKRSENLIFILGGYLVFWLPWAFSPRIMFLYHYSPSVPFMCLLVGYQLNKLRLDKESRKIFFIILGLIILGFIFLYPFLTGVLLPKEYMQLFFNTNLTKNPFK